MTTGYPSHSTTSTATTTAIETGAAAGTTRTGAPAATRPRAWAATGVLAAFAGMAGIAASLESDGVYRPSSGATPPPSSR